MATFGETLKRERELRKISLREVSEATKIGLRYLEALEANRFDRLPGGLFNKGFIRAYAKFIGLDGEAMVNAYLFDLNSQQHPPPPRPRYAGFSIEETAPPVPPAEEHHPPAPPRRRALAGLLGSAVVIVAAILWFVVFRGSSTPPSKPPSYPAQEEKAQFIGDTDGAPAVTGQESAAPAAPEAEAPTAPPPAAEEASPAAIGEEKEIPAPEPEDEDLSLVLSVSETTWISIVCDGTERISREVAAGDSVRLSCRGEIHLYSGNAGTMTLRINGFDCVPLGERGEVIHDFLLDRARALELCPPPSREP